MDWSQGLATCIAQVVFSRLFDLENQVCAFPSPAPSRKGSGSSSSVLPLPSTSRKGGAAHPSGSSRRRQVARCRALRADITSFESEFEAAQGRKPGAGDREAMAGVYNEYRVLKQAVRDDAAAHIQCVYRGWSVRHARLAAARGGSAGVKSKSTGAPVAAASGSGRSSATSGSANVSITDKLSSLKAEKSSLKQKLRAFDSKFLADNGRMPSKPEKEHLRPMYQRYHDLKAMITTLESAVSSTGSSALAPLPGGVSRQTSHGSADEGEDDFAGPRAMDSIASVMGDRVDVDEDEPSGPRRHPPAAAPGSSHSDAKAAAAAALSGAAGGQGGALKELRAEKRRLQQYLREYEREFETREGRKVKFVKDIQPVLEQYTRYKHLKTILKELGAA